MTKFNKTDEEFRQAVLSSRSKRQAITKLGLVPQGGNYRIFDKLCADLNIDISHFKGQGWNKGITLSTKTCLEDYLSNAKSIQSYKLKNLLLKEKYFLRICFNCNNVSWQNQPIPLELDHIDGNQLNNTLLNLRLLCPNCHALNPTYRGKNRKS